MTTISNLAKNLAADGRFTTTDAATLVKEAAKTHAAADVKALLADTALTDKMDAGAKQALFHFLSIEAPSVGAKGTLPDGAKLFLKDGVFMPTPDAALPHDGPSYGASVYFAARIFAEPGQNVVANLSLGEKTAVVERMLVGLQQCKAGSLPPGYEAESQAAQQRSASATVLREIMGSLANGDGQAKLLQDKCLRALVDLVEKETDPGLRDHMSFHLNAFRGALPTTEQKAAVDKAFEKFAPQKPPYDEWFANGNNTLNVVCHTGGEFFDSEVNRWKGAGFVVKSEGGWGQPTVLEKTMKNERGEETKVVLKMTKEVHGTFDDMDSKDAHIVAYSGHSGWGKNIPGELKNAPDMSPPKKVVLVHQCCGQGIINKFRDKYAEADLVTTRYSSTEPEDFFAFSQMLDGVAKRKSWEQIHEGIAGGQFWDNRKNNYITPADELTRMKSRDRDKDGKADILDRLYDFNTFNVQGDTQTAFVGSEPSERDRVLGGERLHNVVQFVNVTAGFSDYLDHKEHGNPFVSAGYFTPKAGADDENRIFSITKKTLDIGKTGASTKHHHDKAGGATQEIFEVKLNSRFAHMSEEAMKGALFMQVAMDLSDGRSKTDRALMGLMLVAHGLTTDSEYGREQLIFDEIVKTMGLPSTLTYADASSFLKADSHTYAGSDLGLEKWRTSLGADKLKALAQALGETPTS